MFSLILKDFLILKRYAIICLIALGSMGYVGYVTKIFPGLIYVITMVMVIYFLVLYNIGYDEKNKSYIVLNSLPINKADVVICKYICIIIFTIITWLAQILFSKFYYIFGAKMGIRTTNSWDLIMAVSIITLYFTGYYPLYFKLGTIKLKAFNTIMYFLIIALPALVPKFVKTSGGKNFLLKLLEFKNIEVLILLLLCISLCVFIISMVISIKIYSEKEF